MNSMKLKILFFCTHNSARSQMAEAWMNYLCDDVSEAISAGLEPGELNPLAVEVMREAGIDITRAMPKALSDVLRENDTIHRIVAVCSEEEAKRCPVIPGTAARLNWCFNDPARFHGTRDQQLENMRKIRDGIRDAVKSWCSVASAAQKFLHRE